MEAFILVNTEAGVLWQVLEAVLKIDGVKTAYGVTGQFDALVLVQFSDLDYLGKIIERIHHVKGVLRTQTLMTIPVPAGTGSVMPSLSEEERMGPNGYPDSARGAITVGASADIKYDSTNQTFDTSGMNLGGVILGVIITVIGEIVIILGAIASYFRLKAKLVTETDTSMPPRPSP